MKKIKHIKFLAAGSLVALAALISSCDKDLNDRNKLDKDGSNSVYVKFVNLIGNATRNYVYVDGVQVSGAQMVYGETLPVHSSSYGFKMPAGLRSFLVRDTLATSTQVPLTFNGNFDANSSYTVFLYDSVIRTKQVTIKNDIVVPDDTTTRLKFGNFMYLTNGGTAPSVDLYSSFFGRRIFTNIAPSQVTEFITYPGAHAAGDTLRTYVAGTNTVLNELIGYTTTKKRSYVVVTRGNYNNVLTTGTGRLLASYTLW